MKKKIHYSDAPMKYGKRVPDFLPKPKDLVLSEQNVRVTLNLSNGSLSFFKELGRKNHIPYQKLIRRYLDAFAQNAGLKS